ncbi:MAG: aminotransferase [Lachnospiraceae bacterium]|nr:aminotransferase [Lachnospiraceae bacterium]
MKKPYFEMTRREMSLEKERLESRFEYMQNLGLHLDMSRGKPSKEQLTLSQGMMDVLNSESELVDETGTDCRNYGVLGGIPEAKRLMGAMSEVKPENMLIFGNSSLNVMFDMVSRSFTHGVCENDPWMHQENVKFLCPVPGYDRHFRITEYFGIDMINVPMSETGPDMDMVEDLVSKDPTIKGIWCVPKYSNPQGYTYSEETVKRFAALEPAADDFRIYWDNAYSIHHLYDDPEMQDYLPEILEECEKAGHPDLVYKFISTSKVSFPGSGIAAVASSKTNLGDIKRHMRVQTIGHDKVNQLRHVRYFKDIEGMRAHMSRMADILRPKFEMIYEMFDRKLGGLGIANWTKPHGGYFISFDGLEGTAKAIVAMCAVAGVKLTPAGATFPYGIDWRDTNIRIAPSYPPIDELHQAAEIFTICVRLVTLNKLLRG